VTDKELQKKLNQMLKLGNELDEEAKRRYGENALLFHEADGGLLIMDELPESGNKSDHVLARASGVVQWGSGAF
jgi:hypothetical protein